MLRSFTSIPRVLARAPTMVRGVALSARLPSFTMSMARSFATKGTSKPAKAAREPPREIVVETTPANNLSSILAKEAKEESALEIPTLPENFALVADNADSSVVELKRTHGREEITIRFHVPPPEDSMPDEESEYFDEFMQSESAQMDPEGKELMENEEEVDKETGPYDGLQHGFTIIIRKPAINQALVFDGVAAEGTLHINGINFYKDGSLPFDSTPDADMKRGMLYQGPKYDDLDADLLAQFTEYLTERGINDNLAQFVHEYVAYKEQNCYMGMLNDIKNFVDAK